ncbi:MAG TPA: hypothetical protein VFW75_17295 [Acetobacteraceae bacterium]|nr:hypothetical protein [Acetobacteraceae bacterium]
MTASARIVALMSAREAAVSDKNTREAGKICAGERRRAAVAYDKAAGEEAGELRGLLEVMANTHAETLRRLESAQHKLDDTIARLNRPKLLS